ncbi:MAG TPA: BadF/BadG/BcrA/BcrD ATPase family protein [Chloroflexota bacterium]|nr:BadF/BadG/BcrA/BcrD ATPase family protein [Chloroflexota bacterium]
MINNGYLLAVDGGQTSTKSLVASLDGTIAGYGHGGPEDHFHSTDGMGKNRSAIYEAIHSALDWAGVSATDVEAIALGLTGVSFAGHEVSMVEGIVREVLQPKHIVVVPDCVTNLAGASAGEAGVVVIAGGGAIAYGVLADGSRQARAGGMGYLFDEGSAFDMGRRAVAAAARASDGRGESTTLAAIIKDTFHIARIPDITKIVYAAGFARERLSALAPFVAREAEAGDSVSLRIITDAANELARLALAVARGIATTNEPISIYPTGGVFKAGAILARPFADAIYRGWPTAVVRIPSYPPVVGALLLARRACGSPIDARWFQRVAETLERGRV